MSSCFCLRQVCSCHAMPSQVKSSQVKSSQVKSSLCLLFGHVLELNEAALGFSLFASSGLVTEHSTATMNPAVSRLICLRQGDRAIEDYVEDFCGLCHLVAFNDVKRHFSSGFEQSHSFPATWRENTLVSGKNILIMLCS